jgi:hypothetical protein
MVQRAGEMCPEALFPAAAFLDAMKGHGVRWELR